jgi:uncharacterized repeat protein (TIGR03803 family)
MKTHALHAGPDQAPTTMALSTARASAQGAAACRRLLAGAAALAVSAGAAAQALPSATESAGHLRVVHSFAMGSDRHAGGAYPHTPLLASDGDLYGVATWGGRHELGTVYRTKPGGSTATVHSFRGDDGANPVGPLIEASDGRLYGVTVHGKGTVFRFDAEAGVATVHAFAGPAAGFSPGDGVVQASDGNLYGTTIEGGQFAMGTLYRLSLDGTYTVMYHFGASRRDGASAGAALMQASDGRLCGASAMRGKWDKGTVFCMTLDGQMSILHEFGSAPDDPAYPTGSLVEGDDGSLYGVSLFGGPLNHGALYRLAPDGRLHVMDLVSWPRGGLLKGSDGNFYGAASGGAFECGWIYRLSSNHQLTDIHSFDCEEASSPNGPLIEGDDGRLLGVATYGPDTVVGVLFSLAKRAR